MAAADLEQKAGLTEVVYPATHWARLRELRATALAFLRKIQPVEMPTLTYGSIARGDVGPSSDIDIVARAQIPTFKLEYVFEEQGLRAARKYLVQSTPNDVVKVVYEFEPQLHFVVPLSPLPHSGYDFYHFGGAISFEELSADIRKPGVTKQLELIEPTPAGHLVSQLADRQREAPKILGISDQMVRQRMRVLTRRQAIGRTGVFLHQELAEHESPEVRLHELAKSNKLLRRYLQR